MSNKIKEMALPGVGKYVFNLIKRFPKKTSFLILASGEGYFENLLLRNGFKDITSCDLYTKNKLEKKVKFLKVDFNKSDFHKKINSKFDVIISMEIIEHLYSVDNFLKNISKLLKKEGSLFISTPNPSSNLSRIDNLLVGYPTLFIVEPGLGDHVTPIYYNILKHFLILNKMKIKNRYYYGSIWNYFSAYNKKGFKSYTHIFLYISLYYILNLLMIYNRSSKIVSIYKIGLGDNRN